MGVFEVTRTVEASPEAVFAVVGDLRRYGDWIPLTRIRSDDGPITTGWEHVGESGLGPLRLPDRMRVTRWEPGRGYSVRKLGPVLDGWAEVDLDPEGAGTRVVWREDITLRPRPLGRLAGVVTDPVSRWMFGRALDLMLAEVRRRNTGA